MAGKLELKWHLGVQFTIQIKNCITTWKEIFFYVL